MIFKIDEFLVEHVFYFLLIKVINVKKGFGASNGRYVDNNSKMACVSTVKFMEDAITVNHNKLRPVFGVSLLKFFKEMKGWRQFPKCKEARNVRLLKFNVLIIFIDNIVVFCVIYDKSGRCTIFKLATETDIDSSNIPEVLDFPLKIVELLDFGFDEFLFLNPEGALLLFEEVLLLLVSELLGLHWKMRGNSFIVARL